MKVALVALVVALVGAGSASAGTVPPIKSIKLPGGKTMCVLVGGTVAQGAGVLCTTQQAPGARPFPPRSCPDFGDPAPGLSMGPTGRATRPCLSENPFVPPIRTLRYGRSITVGAIACVAVSKAVGVRCENANLRGFELSPSAWRRF